MNNKNAYLKYTGPTTVVAKRHLMATDRMITNMRATMEREGWTALTRNLMFSDGTRIKIWNNYFDGEHITYFHIINELALPKEVRSKKELVEFKLLLLTKYHPVGEEPSIFPSLYNLKETTDGFAIAPTKYDLSAVYSEGYDPFHCVLQTGNQYGNVIYAVSNRYD